MENNWVENKKDQIQYFLNSHDIILIERKRCVKLLKDIIKYSFGDKKLKILDFGCGDGDITKQLYKEFPTNKYYLLDGSEVMLEKAKENLKDIQATYIEKTFEDYVDTDVKNFQFDVVFSSMAIHHLDFLYKNAVCSKIFEQLKFDGLFINIDMIQPPSRKIEEIEFQMWRDWMNEELVRQGFDKDIGVHDELPEAYRNKSENKPSKLEVQLDMLKNAGFRDVECFFKYGPFAIMGGFK